MKRASVILLVALLTLMAVGVAGPVSVSAATRVAPKVVLIVGPAGDATDSYRRLADEAAAAAAKYTSNVVRVYSPDATWTAVRSALEGASIVVYLGHGNGWPSPYREVLTPETQNGFGLNPNVGAADAHQYFGEGRIASEVKLAKNAVVIFSHLCYASGNSEPGLPEGALEVGQQRVDNYAAGFVRAGASAVIAEAYMGPAYYVRSILAGKGTIDRIWRNAPTFHGNLLRFDSLRSKGYIAQMDTDRPSSGFHRSIVLREGLVAPSVLAGAVRGAPGSQLPPLEPTLAGLGIEFAAPDLTTPPTVSAKTKLTFRLAGSDLSAVPEGLMVGVRWDLLDGTTPDATAPSSPTTPSPAAPGPAVDPTPASGPDPIDLVTPEAIGEIVAPVTVSRKGANVAVPVVVPNRPGLYRLVGTIHGRDGVAFDAATQALMPALIVRVTGPLTAVYDAPTAVLAKAGESLEVPVGVSNLGSAAWGSPAVLHRLGAEIEPAARATIVARWVGLAGTATATPAPPTIALLPVGLAPGASAAVTLSLAAPTVAGEYLLILDVVAPGAGSLAVAGVPPGIVRVTVSGAAATTTP
jgi:hypothetical protein